MACSSWQRRLLPDHDIRMSAVAIACSLLAISFLPEIATSTSPEDIRQLKIAAVGDSITYGACATDPYRYSYWARLQKWIGPRVAFRYFAQGGMTICSNGAVAMKNQGTLQRELFEWRPDVALLQFGTNDAKFDNWVDRGCESMFMVDYSALIRSLQGLNTTVLIMIPPPVYPPFKYNVNRLIVNEELPRLLSMLAAEHALAQPIDNFHVLGGAELSLPELFCDGVHPINHGYKLMAQQIYAALHATPVIVSKLKESPAQQ